MGICTATDEVDSDDDSDIIMEPVETTVIEEINLSHVNDVRFLNADVFQKKLVEHFDILFKQLKIKWPRSKHHPNM